MIVNAREVEDKFKDYLKEQMKLHENDNTDFYYSKYDYYSYTSEAADKDIDKYVVFLDEKGDITNFSYIENEKGGITAFSLDDVDLDIMKSNFEDIKENYDLPVIYSSDDISRNRNDLGVFSFCEEEAEKGGGFKDRMSKVVDEQYNFPTEIFCLRKEDKERVINKFDEINFPPIEGDLNFEVVDYQKFMYDIQNSSDIIPSLTTEDFNTHLPGFHYCGLVDYKEDNLLVAKDKNGSFVGCIKYGVYGEKDTEHMGLCFVDVKKPYRGNGIATSLMQELGKVVEEYNKENNTNLPIHLTDESEMGQICHMRDVAINNIKGVNLYYDDRNDYKYVAFRDGEEIGNNKNLKDLYEDIKDIGKENVKDILNDTTIDLELD